MKEHKLFMWVFIELEFKLLSYNNLDKHNFSINKIFSPKFDNEIYSLNKILGNDFIKRY